MIKCDRCGAERAKTRCLTMTDYQIDAGAAALRNRLNEGKKYPMRGWGEIPNSVKKKWREYTVIMLCAAMGAHG